MPDANDVIVDMLRDQHRELIGRINGLDVKLESNRQEIKQDLITERATVAANLTKQNDAMELKFDEHAKEIADLKQWRAKAVAYGTVFMFILTFVSQALASGHIPGL